MGREKTEKGGRKLKIKNQKEKRTIKVEEDGRRIEDLEWRGKSSKIEEEAKKLGTSEISQVNSCF